MKPNYRILFGYLILYFCLAPACYSFDDDSKVDVTVWNQGLDYCQDGRATQDTQLSKLSCNDDEVFIGRNGNLIKNETAIFRRTPESFKVSRDGTVFLLFSGKLYREGQVLQSGAGNVVYYMVSTNNRVLYLNDLGDVYRDGKKLDHGAYRVRPLKGLFNKIENPAIGISGDAVYVNENGDIFKNGTRLNPTASRASVLKYSARDRKFFLLDKSGNVYWVSKSGNLFQNSTRVHSGVDPVRRMALDDQGKLLYLTDGNRDNLYYDGVKLNSGGAQVTDFQVLRNGSIIYKDSNGRRWKDGHLTR